MTSRTWIGGLPPLPVALELLAPVGDAGVARQPPADRPAPDAPALRVVDARLRVGEKGDEVGQVADEEADRARALRRQRLSTVWKTRAFSAKERFANGDANVPCRDVGSTCVAYSFRIVAAVADSGKGPGRNRSSVRISTGVVPASIPPGVFDFVPCARE